MARSSECTGSYAHKVLDRDPHCQRRLISSTENEAPRDPLAVEAFVSISLLGENLGDPLAFRVENPIAEAPVYGNERLAAGGDYVQPSVIVHVYDHCRCGVKKVDTPRCGWSLGVVGIGNAL